MRIIAGLYRRRRLLTPAGQDTRPMPNRLRESLFSILGDRIAGKVFVDLYAGSGAVGLEALSRGASKVVFVEIGGAAAETIQRNVQALGAEGSCSLLRAKTEAVLSGIEGDIHFLGPALHRARRIRQGVKHPRRLARPARHRTARQDPAPRRALQQSRKNPHRNPRLQQPKLLQAGRRTALRVAKAEAWTEIHARAARRPANERNAITPLHLGMEQFE